MYYNNYKYIYPPRPENKIAPESLDTFDKMHLFLGQPKLNGSSMQVYTNGVELNIMNRHKKPLLCKIDKEELKKLHKGNGWMVLCGEYMNKSQKDECGKVWNDKFVIFDILVYEGNHLLNSTFHERYLLLEKLYEYNVVKKHISMISQNCFRVNSIYNDFKYTYDDLIKSDMYEGLVLKQLNGKLENGFNESNNVKTQLKCRKGNKNYKF